MLPAKSITLKSMFGSRGNELSSWTTAKARVPLGSLTRIDCDGVEGEEDLDRPDDVVRAEGAEPALEGQRPVRRQLVPPPFVVEVTLRAGDSQAEHPRQGRGEEPRPVGRHGGVPTQRVR